MEEKSSSSSAQRRPLSQRRGGLDWEFGDGWVDIGVVVIVALELTKPKRPHSQWRGLYQHFHATRVPQEALRAGARTVGAALENCHQIANLRDRQLHAIA